MGLLSPHPGLILWTIVTFAVVLLVLRSKVWGPLLAALDERERRIREALESADRAHREAQARLEEHSKRLAEAEQESRRIIAEAHEAATKVGHRIVEEARQEAQHTVDMATESIEAEKRAALSQLRHEVADLAVQAAGAILDAELDAERNRKLADDFIRGLPPARSAN